MKDKTKLQTKPAVDREAVRVLAIELGAREAARRLGLKESTVLSWARRNGWKLPKRKGGGSGKNAIALAIKPGDALIATHEQLEGVTKTGLKQALAKAARQVAGKDALDISNTAQLRDICLAAARIFGWKDEPQTAVNITNQVGVVCSEQQRQRLIELREKLQTTGPAPMNLPEPSAKSQPNGPPNSSVAANGGTPNGTLSAIWSAPVGATAPGGASPTYRAWLEHEGPEPE